MNAGSLESPTTSRRLSRAELAFVRCWAEGVDVVDAWRRYMADDGSADARRAHAALRELLDLLRTQARALGRPALAVLLRTRAPTSPGRTASPPVPTLDEFRAEVDADFYTEAELLELHRQRFDPDGLGSEVGPASAAASVRQGRLRRRLTEGLLWLERQAPRAPQPVDPIAAWLDAPVAQRLARAGLRTLDDLVARAGRRGGRWYRSVPRLGPAGAGRLEAWLRAHESSLGRLGEGVGPSRQPASVVVLRPLERLLPSGSGGPADGGWAVAGDDIDAVKAWVGRRSPGTNTWRAYRREAERFLLWAGWERRKPLAELQPDDARAYIAFLSAPPSDWTAPRRTGRDSDEWRPFEGPLSPASQAIAVRILRLLCDDLVAQGRMTANPWRTEAARAATPASGRITVRALAPDALRLLRGWVAARPPSPAHRRLRAALELACGSGLRRSELVAARCSGPRIGGGAALTVVTIPNPTLEGCGPRQLTVPPAVVESFRESLTDRPPTARFSSNVPGGGLAMPWLARLDDGGPLSPDRLYEVLKQGFRQCAADLARRHPQAAAEIAVASPHWLRHTHGVSALVQGVSPAGLRERMGHRSLVMVSAYRREARRWAAGR